MSFDLAGASCRRLRGTTSGYLACSCLPVSYAPGCAAADSLCSGRDRPARRCPSGPKAFSCLISVVVTTGLASDDGLWRGRGTAEDSRGAFRRMSGLQTCNYLSILRRRRATSESPLQWSHKADDSDSVAAMLHWQSLYQCQWLKGMLVFELRLEISYC
jgi:hypothetical protein